VALNHPETRDHLVPLIKKQATSIRVTPNDSMMFVMHSYLIQVMQSVIPLVRVRFPSAEMLDANSFNDIALSGDLGTRLDFDVMSRTLTVEVFNPSDTDTVTGSHAFPLVKVLPMPMKMFATKIAQAILQIA